MSRIIRNFRYTDHANRLNKEMHSADGKTFICGDHGDWETHVRGKHVVSFWRREDAREFIREEKKAQLRLPFNIV